MEWSTIKTTATWFEYIGDQPFQRTDIVTTDGEILRYCGHAPDHEIMPVQEVLLHLNRLNADNLPSPNTGD